MSPISAISFAHCELSAEYFPRCFSTSDVICITHLAQIAKFGAHHFQITKHVSKGRTHTDIRPLKPEDRVLEIARMLGGEQMTEATLSHARELLENS